MGGRWGGDENGWLVSLAPKVDIRNKGVGKGVELCISFSLQ
jgi:hypothetical protein